MRRLLFALLVVVLGVLPAQAQTARPFGLPVALPPGPSTWLLGQPYGNTVGAYLRGDEWYRAGQRLHFGIDLSMPCGTPLVAIGDGEVMAVSDLSFGSAPHNLLIRHDAGYTSLYGHLLERPALAPGMRVTRGQQVGLSGDPDLTCFSRPHLHLEIRSLDYRTAYNPVALIDADWETLALIGQFRYPMFQHDLDNVRRWVTLTDQPDVAFGGGALNLYAATFPDPLTYSVPANPPIASEGTMPLTESPWTLRRLAGDGCCINAWWSTRSPNLLYLLDGANGTRASIFEWDAVTGAPTGIMQPAPPPLLSPDGQVRIERVGSEAVLTTLSDGAQARFDTGGAVPALSTDNRQAVWTRTAEVALPGETGPRTTIWLSNADGSGARALAEAPGLGAQWLDAARLLVTQRENATTTLFVYDTVTGETFTLGAYQFLRGMSIAPGGGRLMFYLAYQSDPAADGVYTVATQAGAVAEKLPWFGAWRWRGGDGVFYVPFTTTMGANGVPSHVLRHYDLVTGADVALTDPNVTPFRITNGDWSVSPDGQRIAFLNAADLGTWLLEAGA